MGSEEGMEGRSTTSMAFWLGAHCSTFFFIFYLSFEIFFSSRISSSTLCISLSRTERERTGLADSLVYKKEWQWHKKGGGGNMEPAKKGHESPTNDGRMPAASASAQDDVVLYMGEVASVSHCNRLDPPSSSCKNP